MTCAGAEAAYRRADARGSADGAFNLAGLLLERGDTEGAIAAYRRADERGDAGAAATLGLVFIEQGDRGRGAGCATAELTSEVMPGPRSTLVCCSSTEGIWRAPGGVPPGGCAGSADGAFNLGALFEQRGDLANAATAYHRADERGDAGAAARLGMLLERRHDYRRAPAGVRASAEIRPAGDRRDRSVAGASAGIRAERGRERSAMNRPPNRSPLAAVLKLPYPRADADAGVRVLIADADGLARGMMRFALGQQRSDRGRAYRREQP